MGSLLLKLGMNDDDNCVCRMINGCFVCKLNYNIIYNTINSHLYNVEDVSILTRDYLLNSFSSRLVYRRIFRTDIGILLHEVTLRSHETNKILQTRCDMSHELEISGVFSIFVSCFSVSAVQEN